MHNSDRTHNALQDARVGAGVNPKNVLSLVEKPRKCSQWSWCCDNCGTQGGMSAFIEQCPECRHIRCGSCQMERLSPKDVYYKSQKTSLKRGALLSKGTSAPRLPWPEAQAGNSFQATSAPTLVERREDAMNCQTNMQVQSRQENSENTAPDNCSSNFSNTHTEANKILFSTSSTPLSTSSQSSSWTIQSRTYSETFSHQPEHSDSATEVDSEYSESEVANTDMESDIEDEGRAILVLESCLLSVFSGDFALAALIIPQVHAAAYLELDSGHTAYTAAVTHGPNGGTGSGGATTSCMRTSTAANGNTSANTVPQKHGRNPDDSEEYDKPPGNRKTKRIKATSGNRPRTFACHFHKKDPEKYGPWIHQKYLPCIAPCVPALHRIKDHFKAVHRPKQCDRCYIVFKDRAELVAHRGSPTERCYPKPPSLKEGIDDGQWDKLYHLKAKNDREKWFEIWRILFPGIPEPKNPWNEPVYPTTPRPYDAVDIVARFESSVAAEFRRRNIQQDERAHLVYLNALRSIVDAGTTPMDDVEGYMSSPPRLNVPGAEILEPHSELVVPSVTSRMLSGTHNSSQYIEELQFSPPSSGPTSGTGPPAYTFDDTVLLSHGIATPQALQLLPTYRSEIPPVPNSVGSSNPAHDWNSVPLPPQQPIATRNFTTEQPIDSWLDLTLGTIDEKMVEPFEVAHPNASEPPSNLYRDEFDLHNAGQFDLNLYPISLDVNDNSDMNNMLELEAEHATATTEWKTKHDGNKALPQL